MEKENQVTIGDGTIAKVGDVVHLVVVDQLTMEDLLTTGKINCILKYDQDSDVNLSPVPMIDFVEVDVDGLIVQQLPDYMFSTRKTLVEYQISVLLNRVDWEETHKNELEVMIHNIEDEMAKILNRVHELKKEINA